MSSSYGTRFPAFPLEPIRNSPESTGKAYDVDSGLVRLIKLTFQSNGRCDRIVSRSKNGRFTTNQLSFFLAPLRSQFLSWHPLQRLALTCSSTPPTMMKIVQLACLLLTLLSASVSAKKSVVKKVGSCTGSSTSKIKLAPQNGNLEIEFEVEHKSNEVWSVVIKRSNAVIYTKDHKMSATTQSFEARVVSSPGTSGSINAVATSKSSGEKCSVTASLA